MRRRILILLAAVLLCIFNVAYADLEIQFLDVGQGDAILVICDGESLLIDGGPASASRVIYSALQNLPLRAHLDYVIATHPHEDHVGGLSAALNAAQVDLILSPVESWEFLSFNSFLKYARLQGTPIAIPEEGDQLQLGSATITILHCWPEAWDENDMSIVCRIDYGGFSALFTGDAGSMAEYMLADRWADMRATLLKIGHHGSVSSTTSEFLRKVSPEYAVISCGAGNEYGHPHQEVLNSLKESGITTYRTDLMGTIVFRVDRDGNICITTDRSSEQKDMFYAPAASSYSYGSRSAFSSETFVINEKTRKFHLPACESVQDISIKNRKEYTGDREDLIDAGYIPCRRCNP